MKTPEELRERLRRRWRDPVRREEQLLRGPWPLTLPINEPPSHALRDELDKVRAHLNLWRRVRTGHVEWLHRTYRDVRTPVEIPFSWQLPTPSEWVAAIEDVAIQREYNALANLVPQALPALHGTLVRLAPLLAESEAREVAQACRMATHLARGSAHGLPLRALPCEGHDTKFWERNRKLLSALLEQLHPGEVRSAGLEAFLGAAPGGEHWLHLIDLDGGLLPWSHMQVRDRDLATHAPPGHTLLIVENLQCRHQLALERPLSGTVAVLGSGLNLAWMQAPWLARRRVGYWGDIDTWGLTMLAQARERAPHLHALLMTQALFDQLAPAHAAIEALPAPLLTSSALRPAELALDAWLREQPKGRVEQEYVPATQVHDAIRAFAAQTTNATDSTHARPHP